MKSTQRLQMELGKHRRGFLLMIVIGLLSVLLMLCLGFLAFTRSELNAVSHLRDKADSQDLAQSACDWMIATISNELCAGGNSMDPAKYVTLARNGQWWYKPFEPGFTSALTDKTNWPEWNGIAPHCLTPDDEAKWTYVPVDYLPEGGASARFSVQVLDPNSVPNLNDWLEDCNPTQCQMAHIIMDGYGEQQLEMMRSWRDGGSFDRWPGAPDFALLRYHEAWRVGTRTVRYLHWPFGMIDPSQGPGGGSLVHTMLSPNWVTTNTSYVGLYGADMCSLKPLFCTDGMALPGSPMATPAVTMGPNKYFPPSFPTTSILWNSTGTYADPVAFPADATPPVATSDSLDAVPPIKTPIKYHGGGKHLMGNLPVNMPFSLRAYTDPDTGRSPINVNTCYNSGEKLPCSMLGGTPTYAMEAVFNVESLRRIIKIGSFYESTGKKVSPNPADPNYISTVLPLVVDQEKAWQKHEDLRTKLAFQYQETLCLYFTGTYNHSSLRKYPPLGAAANPSCGMGASCTDYSQPRFPMGVGAFRSKVLSDLRTMATGSPLVNFNAGDTADVLPGHLDARTANAIWDNIVPGKPDLADDSQWPAKQSVGGDPLTELYRMRLGRDELRPTNGELTTAPARWNANVHGFFDDNATLKDTGYGGGLHLRPKGLNVALTIGADPVTGNPIPIHQGPYDNGVVTIPGDSVIGSAIITNVGSTAGLSIGDKLTPLPLPGYGFPANVQIVSMTATTITMSAKATAPNPYGRVFDFVHGTLVTVTIKGDTTAGSSIIKNIPTTAGLVVGSTFSVSTPATLFPATATITALTTTTATLSAGASSSSTGGSLTFQNALRTYVPYRQLCFGPDWFSTELTTCTTTFVFIINAQIVETRTAGAPNPNVLYSSQWGVCVEIAPDVTLDIDTSKSAQKDQNYYANNVRNYSATNVAGEFNGPSTPQILPPAIPPAVPVGIGSPGYYKTRSYDSMDLASWINNQYGLYKTTVSPEWDADLRGIPPAQVSPLPPLAIKTGFNTTAYNAANFYGGPNQIKKRVLVRAVWSLTDNANR